MTAAAAVSRWRHRMALVAAAVIVIAVGGFVLAQISGTPGEPRVSCIGVDLAECDRLRRDVLADTGEESTDGLGRNRVAKVTVMR